MCQAVQNSGKDFSQNQTKRSVVYVFTFFMLATCTYSSVKMNDFFTYKKT